MFRKATDDKQLADENSDDRREQNLARGRALLPATKPTSIEPQRERLGGGVLLRLGEVVEEAPAGLDVDVHVPGELPERHRRLPGQPGHQILGREPPHETTAKNPAHGCHRQRQGPPGSRHCCSCSQEPTELGGGEEATEEVGCPVDGASEEEAAAALVGAIYRGRGAFSSAATRKDCD